MAGSFARVFDGGVARHCDAVSARRYRLRRRSSSVRPVPIRPAAPEVAFRHGGDHRYSAHLSSLWLGDEARVPQRGTRAIPVGGSAKSAPVDLRRRPARTTTMVLGASSHPGGTLSRLSSGCVCLRPRLNSCRRRTRRSCPRADLAVEAIIPAGMRSRLRVVCTACLA